MLLCCSVSRVTHTRITAAPLQAHSGKIPAFSPTLTASMVPTEKKRVTMASQIRITHDSSSVGQKICLSGWNIVQHGSLAEGVLPTCRVFWDKETSDRGGYGLGVQLLLPALIAPCLFP